MTNIRQKQNVIGWFLIVLLLAAVWWTYSLASAGRLAAGFAAEDARKCQYLADQIQAIKDTPQVASSHELEGTALLRRIDQASEKSGMRSPKKITPQPATRVGNNKAYKEKPVRIEWDGVSMQEIVTTLHDLTTHEAGLRVKSIEMRASKSNANQWDVTATLAQLVYDPVKTQNTRTAKR